MSDRGWAQYELCNLVQRYARAVDDRDLGVLADLFHPDAQISGSRGSASRAEWLATMEAPRAFGVSMHMMGSPLITLSSDGQEASLDTYAVVYQLSEEGAEGAQLTLGVRYLDQAVVHQGRWVIRHRQTRTIWMR